MFVYQYIILSMACPISKVYKLVDGNCLLCLSWAVYFFSVKKVHFERFFPKCLLIYTFRNSVHHAVRYLPPLRFWVLKLNKKSWTWKKVNTESPNFSRFVLLFKFVDNGESNLCFIAQSSTHHSHPCWWWISSFRKSRHLDLFGWQIQSWSLSVSKGS